MKKILILTSILALLAIVCCPNASAQTTTVPEEKITVNKSDLTTAQIAKIENEAKIADLQKKLDIYGKWVGVGGEIGTAVKEGLTAVVDVADKFGTTKVGKFTMVLIGWKVIGKDIVRIFLGLIFITVITVFMFRMYKKTFTVHRVANESNGLRFWLPKTYTIVTPERWEGFEFVKICFVFLYAGSIGLTYAIMFA